jgi:putative flavoprotein involved in K+ transport
MNGAVAQTAAEDWLAEFAEAAEGADVPAVVRLVGADAYWRDLLALTWGLHTFYGREQIATMLTERLRTAGASSFRLLAAHPPRVTQRAGQEVVELAFSFRAAVGGGRGVATLRQSEGGRYEAWTVLTELDRLEAAGLDREPTTYLRDFAEPNWLERRTAEGEYRDADPAVVVVGAGQAGLAVAARLRHSGVDTLVVERSARVGDNWRNRYRALVLHNEVWANHLPFLEFPENWPTYIPKDLLADWLEAYAEFMQLNVWTSCEVLDGSYDDTPGTWALRVRRADGTDRVLRPRHVIMAPGVSSIPYQPVIPGLAESGLEVRHSSEYGEAHAFAGRRVVVFGTGTSGHDIAQDLHAHGVDVTLVQRSSSSVVNVGPDRAGKVYDLYRQGLPVDVADLVNVSVPYPLLRQGYQLVTRDVAELDADLLTRLRRVGFRLDFGADHTGFQMKYLRQGGGYYINVGCSDLVADGEVGLLQAADISGFGADGVHLADGSVHAADVIVLATGFLGQEEVTRRLFGEAVAARVGPVWGHDDEGELRSMWCRTGQPGLWFTAGSLAQCRIYSKYLALQVEACELGLLPVDADVDGPRGRIRDADLVDVWDGRLATAPEDELVVAGGPR